MKLVSPLITLYAALLGICGGALLFLPGEVGALVTETAGGQSLLAQLLGAALLGFAVTCWLARRAVLGGIYGRAVVAGNQAFAFVGALTLLGSIPAAPGVGYWVLLAVLAGGAALFTWLLLRGPGSRARRDEPDR